MAIEIERKFLIHADKLPPLENGVAITQGYIPTETGTTVRVRLAGDKSHLCIKSPYRNISRDEYEFAIPMADAREMLERICTPQPIKKKRYLHGYGGLLWEIDVFQGLNEGLIMAEIELKSEDQDVDMPDWIATEVSHDKRYSNSYLAINPFCNW